MASGYKASPPPFTFHSTQQQVLFILLLLLVLLMPFITGTTTPTSAGNITRGCIETERDALLAFKAELRYSKVHPISSWGDQTDDCCQWAGVRCDNISGHVVHLNLQRRRPRQYYDYYLLNPKCDEWDLSGTISQSLIGLQHLTYLDLSLNCFTGVVPHELGNLTKLRYLDLAINDRLKVDDAEWLSGLSALRYLYMDHTNFSGVNNVMQSLNKLRHLKNASLFACSMNSIPESLPHLNFTSLTFMEIGWNMFHNMSIPEWLFRMPKLHDLYMEDNGLTGTIPCSIRNATSLQLLDLSWNRGMSGDMPREFGDLCNLQSIHLDGTFMGKRLEDFRDAFSGCIRRNLNVLSFEISSLQGPLPDWLGEFRNLNYLSLSFNFLHGSIPESLGRLSRLQSLYLGDNALNGSIPESLGRLSGLQYLDLSINDLNGPIPESLWQLSNLVDLALSANNFNYYSVITEAHLANLTKLKYLSLSELIFNISIDWIPGFQAEQISLSSCRVGPKFPVWLANQVNLGILGMSYTGIKDSVPDWFWNITNTLTFLDLSNNEINGRLPQRLKFQVGQYPLQLFFGSNHLEGSIPYFPPNVYWLDLSNNSFSGMIPSDFGNFGGIRPQLTFLSLSSNNLTGTIPNSLCNLADLVLLELSDNHLEGVIPNCWNNLTGLQYLILANNSLEGEIPSNIGLMQSLESLDLSRNELIGSIPTSLSTLHFLGSLNLSHNNLSGKIPYTSQLTTLNDPSIYAGNLNLCGAPLNKNCTSDEPPSNTHDQENDDNDNLPIWFYTGLMLGFVVGFWIVWGILLFKKNWRHIYFLFLDHMYDMMYVKIVVTIHKIKKALAVKKSK
ncbi:receptor-like protein EIX2 [Dioscorea cayenensis subsp. rotundata]|uniref:Receptor-like protein EIX2 n=1 Tax=Dioscorea cayennensis subsp. rotundata TaxID=55577 RepID=A0AB40CAM3_DIOCR|nr:receptor-like protein EIX2 [Dioscorea cayenensis subsp. rotundata]